MWHTIKPINTLEITKVCYVIAMMYNMQKKITTKNYHKFLVYYKNMWSAATLMNYLYVLYKIQIKI